METRFACGCMSDGCYIVPTPITYLLPISYVNACMKYNITV